MAGLTGVEMLLNSVIKLLKLEPQVEQVKSKLVASGAIDKLSKFVDELDEFIARQKRMEAKIDAIYETLGIEPCSGPAACGRDDFANRSIAHLNGSS